MTAKAIVLVLAAALLIYGITIGDFMETWRNGATL